MRGPEENTQAVAPDEFRPVVVAPTYNNAATLPNILDRLAALDLPIIVVNDGCTDATGALLSARLDMGGRPCQAHASDVGRCHAQSLGKNPLSRPVNPRSQYHEGVVEGDFFTVSQRSEPFPDQGRARTQGLPRGSVQDKGAAARLGFDHESQRTGTEPSGAGDGPVDADDRLTVITHARNRGKAAALRSGFATARSMGFTHAATIDTDGQLMPEEIPQMLAAARANPSALVLGSRLDRAGGCPGSHRLGWWMSALGLWLETGRRVLDSQCGLRVYPLRLFEVVRARAGRFGFETEIITRAAWAGAPLVAVPATCHYFRDGKGVSHFRPWRDGIRTFLMQAGLTIRRLIPWPHRTLANCRLSIVDCRFAQDKGGPGQPNRQLTIDNRQSATCSPTLAVPLSQSWGDWISPAALWRRLRQDRFEQLLIAGAAGIGSFMAAMPLGGWQVLLAAYASRRLHVHLIPAILGSMLCLPPIGDGINRVAVTIGSVLARAQWPSATVLEAAGGEPWPLLAQMPLAWPIGAVITGFFLNWITIPVLVRVFRLIPVRNES